MGRAKQPVELVNFVGGFITEASPLAFPNTASSDENNMRLNRDGSRQRRFGFDLENSYSETDTGLTFSSVSRVGITQANWDNAGGDPEKRLLVVQVGNHLSVYDLETLPFSGNLVYEETFNSSVYDTQFDYAVVDGILIVVNGDKNIYIYEYDEGVVTKSLDKLKIRDLFGIVASSGEAVSRVLTDKENNQYRPEVLTDEHLYNLRNQTFALPRVPGNAADFIVDPIADTFSEAAIFFGTGVYPSNADTVVRYLGANPASSGSKSVERFQSKDMLKSPPGNFEAPKGYFIIDALDRGTSRQAREVDLRADHPILSLSVSVDSLPIDETPGGATVVEEFAGRLWYAGFSGDVIDGDERSPRMSSYVLFSNLVADRSNIASCYQQGDPTANTDFDLVDTDGGFIRVDGAYGIIGLQKIKNSLFVIAKNGVWRILGGNDEGFSSTNYRVDRLTSDGCASKHSIVPTEDSLFYWGETGIYHVTQNQFGDWVVNSITEQTIRTFYSNISTESKAEVSGHFDSYQRKVHWIYREDLDNSIETKGLIFDIGLQAFSKDSILTSEGSLPKLVGVFTGNPFSVIVGQQEVLVGLEDVEANGEQVITLGNSSNDTSRDLHYLVITELFPTIKYSFGSYTDTSFKDWSSITVSGIDTPAYLLSGATNLNTQRFKKQLPYLHVSMKKTETDFSSDFEPNNQSSCLIRVHWDWTNQEEGNKWSRQFQAYRPKTKYFPANTSDEPYRGFTLIKTRNKIRGSGNSLAIEFRSEEGKAMHLYGWAFDVTTTTDE